MKSEHWWNRLSAASSLFSHTSLPLLLIVLRLFPRTVPLRLLDGLPRRFYCKMAAHLPLTHRSFSKLLNGSVKLMPFSLFGLISIRVWQIPMRQFEFLQFIPMFLTFFHISSGRRCWRVSCIAAALKLLQCLARGLFRSDVWYQSPDRCLPDGITPSCRHQELNQQRLCSLFSSVPAGQSDRNRYFQFSLNFLFHLFIMFSASLQQL